MFNAIFFVIAEATLSVSSDSTWDKVILQENNVVAFCMQILLYHQTNSFTISTTLFGSSSCYMERVFLCVCLCVLLLYLKNKKKNVSLINNH